MRKHKARKCYAFVRCGPEKNGVMRGDYLQRGRLRLVRLTDQSRTLQVKT